MHRSASGMYSAQTTNGNVGLGSGTINPAALSSSGMVLRSHLVLVAWIRAIAGETVVCGDFFIAAMLTYQWPLTLSFEVGALSNNTATITPDTSPNQRGIKRSRSPDIYDTSDQFVGDDGTSCSMEDSRLTIYRG